MAGILGRLARSASFQQLRAAERIGCTCPRPSQGLRVALGFDVEIGLRKPGQVNLIDIKVQRRLVTTQCGSSSWTLPPNMCTWSSCPPSPQPTSSPLLTTTSCTSLSNVQRRDFIRLRDDLALLQRLPVTYLQQPAPHQSEGFSSPHETGKPVEDNSRVLKGKHAEAW